MPDKADNDRANSVVVEGGKLFHISGHKRDKLSRLCACCEQLGLCVLNAGTELPGAEGAPLFRAHLVVSDAAGKSLSEATCQHLSMLLAGRSWSRTADQPPPSQSSSQRAVSFSHRKPANAAGIALQAASSLPAATTPQAAASWRANSDPQCFVMCAQLRSASTAGTDPVAMSLSSTTSCGSSFTPGTPEQVLTPLSSTGAERGTRELTPPAGRKTTGTTPTPMQTSLDAAVETQPSISPLAASISHLTEQAKGVSTPVRYKMAAAIWELDHEALQIHRKIGEGSYGEVLLGTYKGTRVAVKRLHDTVPVVAKLFEQEIEIMAGIRHPNVVNFYGACHSPNLCLVTEHCARGSLDHLLHKSGMPLDLVRKTEFSIDIARGMNCLHEQRPAIIHRDLKTGNLLVSTRFEIKVSDFGLSRLKYEREQQSSRPALEGTVEYCSPEVLRGDPYSEKCDVWSYGVVLHELLTQTRPYAEAGVSVYLLMLKVGDGTLELPPIPENLATPGLIRLVQRCLSFRPQDRPSFRDVLYFLEPELRVARGRSSAVRRSVTSNCIISPQQPQEQHQHRAAQEQRTPAAQLQPGMSPTQSAELEREHTSRRLEDCQAQLRSSRSELRNSQSELQQLQQAVVKEAAPFTPPARAQPPLPLMEELRSSPSADLAVFAEPVVALKAKECTLQQQQQRQRQQEEEQQRQQQQQQRQQQEADEQQEGCAGASGAPTQSSLRQETTLPCITEESSQAASSSGSTTPSSVSFAGSRHTSELPTATPRLNSLLGLPAPLLHSTSMFSMSTASSRNSSSSKLSSKGAAPPASTHTGPSTQSAQAGSSGVASAPGRPSFRRSHTSTGVGQGASSSGFASSPFAAVSHAFTFGDTGDPRPSPAASPFALASLASSTIPDAGVTGSVPPGRSSPFAVVSHAHSQRSTRPLQSEHDPIAGWL